MSKAHYYNQPTHIRITGSDAADVSVTTNEIARLFLKGDHCLSITKPSRANTSQWVAVIVVKH